MGKWLLGACVLAGAVAGVCSLNSSRPLPLVGMPAEPLTVAVIPTPEVAVISPVVEVTDIDVFLEPPSIPVVEPRASSGPVLNAVGYDEPTVQPVQPASAVVPIPPAVEDEE